MTTTPSPKPTGYCRNCGKELIGKPELCMNCGARPSAGNSFCPACGAATNALADICIKCGARLGASTVAVEKTGGKSKTAAVLLAIFLTFWTWLYTYKRNGWKFWLSLGVQVLNIILIVVTFGVWIFVGWILSAGIWIWAIVDVATKSDEWYRSY